MCKADQIYLLFKQTKYICFYVSKNDSVSFAGCDKPAAPKKNTTVIPENPIFNVQYELLLHKVRWAPIWTSLNMLLGGGGAVQRAAGV